MVKKHFFIMSFKHSIDMVRHLNVSFLIVF